MTCSISSADAPATRLISELRFSADGLVAASPSCGRGALCRTNSRTSVLFYSFHSRQLFSLFYRSPHIQKCACLRLSRRGAANAIWDGHFLRKRADNRFDVGRRNISKRHTSRRHRALPQAPSSLSTGRLPPGTFRQGDNPAFIFRKWPEQKSGICDGQHSGGKHGPLC